MPFYSNGALFVRGWGLGPLVDGNGLFHSVGSYCNELYIGITCCRAMMPDPEFYAECLRESLGELSKAFQLESEEIIKAPAVSKLEPRKKARAKKTTKKKKLRKNSIKSKKVSTERA